jgi:DNA-binding NarL/FixJ family response regulator
MQRIARHGYQHGWVGLRAILASMSQVCITAEVSSAEQALSLALETRPDAILAATHLEGHSSLPLIRQLHTKLPATTIVLLATSYDPGTLVELASLDVAGYLLWSDMDSTTFIAALTAVLTGEVSLASRTVARAYVASQQGQEAPCTQLTAREQTVLQGLSTGLTQKQIAVAERIPLRTVQATIARLQEKLDAPSLFLLGRQAARLRLV